MNTYKKFLIILYTGLLALNFDIQASQKEKSEMNADDLHKVSEFDTWDTCYIDRKDVYSTKDKAKQIALESDQEDNIDHDALECNEEDTIQEITFLEKVNLAVENALKDPKIRQSMKTLCTLIPHAVCAELILEYMRPKRWVVICKSILNLFSKGTYSLAVKTKDSKSPHNENITVYLFDAESQKELICLNDDNGFKALLASQRISLTAIKDFHAKNESLNKNEDSDQNVEIKEKNNSELNKIVKLPNGLFAVGFLDPDDLELYENFDSLYIWDNHKKISIAQYEPHTRMAPDGIKDIILFNNKLISASNSEIALFDLANLSQLIPEIIIAYNKYGTLRCLAPLSNDTFITVDNDDNLCIWQQTPSHIMMVWETYRKQMASSHSSSSSSASSSLQFANKASHLSSLSVKQALSKSKKRRMRRKKLNQI